MITLLLAAIAHGGAHDHPAYPIDSWTLRKHIQYADLLAIAEAGPTVSASHRNCRSSWDCDSTTLLQIKQVLKGEDPGKQITVGTRQSVL